MSFGLTTLDTVIVFLVFLITLNESLLGASKERIRTALFLSHIALLLLVFFIYGWVAGTVAVVLIAVSAIVWAPVARMVANKILGFRPSSAMLAAYTPAQFERDQADLARTLSAPEIETLLNEFGLTEDDLLTWASIVTPEVVLRTVRNPKNLRMILEQKSKGVPDVVIMHKLRQI